MTRSCCQADWPGRLPGRHSELRWRTSRLFRRRARDSGRQNGEPLIYKCIRQLRCAGWDGPCHSGMRPLGYESGALRLSGCADAPHSPAELRGHSPNGLMGSMANRPGPRRFGYRSGHKAICPGALSGAQSRASTIQRASGPSGMRAVGARVHDRVTHQRPQHRQNTAMTRIWHSPPGQRDLNECAHPLR